MTLTDEEKQAIMDSCLDDSTKVIRYLKEQEEKQKPYNLVQHCINSRVISTRCSRHRRVGVSQRCHRIASFHRLALTRTSGTDYFKINATQY